MKVRSSGRHIMMMGCPECDSLCWKDRRMNTIHCESCGLEVEGHFEGPNPRISDKFHPRRTDIEYEKGGVNRGFSPFLVTTPNNNARYDNSGVTRLHGGYEDPYQGEGEYEFGSMEDSLLEMTVSASD